MNALPILKAISVDVKNTERWLEDRYLSESALAGNADRIIRHAEELKRLRDARIADLKENGPKAYFEGGALNITLLRDGKEHFYDFTEQRAFVCSTDKPEVLRRLRIEGAPDESGVTHYINVSCEEYGTVAYGIYVSKAEAEILRVRIREAERAEYPEDY
jgi:hypothetical protein